MKKVTFEKGDIVAVPNSALTPSRVLHVGENTLIVKSEISNQNFVIRRDFCKHATKLDIDQVILKVSKDLMDTESKIEQLENLKNEVSEAVYATID